MFVWLSTTIVNISIAGETTNFVSELIRHADELYVFARNFRRRYHLSIKAADKYYTSSGFKDELVWAAAWLYRATGVKSYLEWVSDITIIAIISFLVSGKNTSVSRIFEARR